MNGKKISLIILTAFVLGTAMLIYVHSIFSKNNDALIEGNEKLLGEVKVNSQLKDLEKAIVTVESSVRGTVVANDSTYFKGAEEKIMEAESNLDQLQKIADDDSSVFYIDRLDTLVQHKLRYEEEVLNTFHLTGKKAAENMFASRYGISLTDSIINTLHKIDSTRKKHFDDASISIRKSSKNAQQFITVLIASVLIGGAVLFWFIITTIRRQGQLIHQLNISEKKVREAAQIKENFLANMSHEIRTPMNAILGFTNLLKRKKLDAESEEYVQTIQKSGDNLLTIINDILDLSKIEAGMMRIESSPFSIRELVHSVESMFIDKMKSKGLQLFTMVDQTLPDTLNGDATRLTQILINLIGNSLKFTNKGNIAIQIINRGIEDSVVNTEIIVTDTGIGIEKEKLGKIFGRFQQADDAVTRKYGGTGLGLAIVNDLVDLQRGSIKVESEVSQGTTFRIAIPYKIATENITRHDLKDFAVASQSNFEDVKILVAEDNEINQSLIKHLFKNWSLACDIVNNGKEAIDILQTKTYNLVLMDIQMPEMDGYTATREIRDDLKLEIPIVAMTAHAFAGEREKCLSYGMNDYISKPIREDELRNLISQFTQNKQMAETQKREVVKPIGSAYKYINLKYMKEISNGNIEYEKTVTKQFIDVISEEIVLLEKASEKGQHGDLRQLAHNMKTTISVMGLNELLQPYLDALEYEDVSADKLQSNISFIKSICTAAIAEAQLLYSSY